MFYPLPLLLEYRNRFSMSHIQRMLEYYSARIMSQRKNRLVRREDKKKKTRNDEVA